jgi:hypothetical protein
MHADYFGRVLERNFCGSVILGPRGFAKKILQNVGKDD